MQSSSLSSWTLKLQRQCAQVLDPTLNPHSEIDATEQLTRTCDDNPAWTLMGLAQLAKDDDASSIRTLALTLLRRFVTRPSPDEERGQIWDTVPVTTHKQTQTTLLECIECIALRGDSTEGEKNSLCKTVAFIHEMDISRGHAWPALETCLQKLVSDEKSTRDQQDLYYKFLYENPAMVADAPIPDLIRNLINGLQAISSPNYLSISSIEAAVAVLQVDDRAMEMLDVVPNILDVLPRLAHPEDERAQGALGAALIAFMEIYNAGEDCVTFLQPYLSNFIPFILSLLSGEFSSAICNSAMEILASTAELSPSLIQTQFLEEMKNAVRVLLGLMEKIPGDALDRDFWNADVEDDDHELEQIHIVAEDALDRIGVAMGGQNVLSAAFELIPSMQASQDWKKRYAAMSAIGTLAEGSVKQFRSDVDAIMQLVLPVLTDSNPRLVYAAIYCVAELCSYLEGAVQEKFGDTILGAYLRILMVPSAPPRLIAYTCAALVNYTEDLQTLPPSLLSHASPLLQQLHNLLTNPTSRQDVRLKAMSSIAQLASVLAQAKELKHDVYEGVMQSLWVYLDGEVDNEVRARAMDCMSLIAVSVGKGYIAPQATKLITSLLHIQRVHTEPDDPCTSGVLTALARLAEALGEDFLPHVDCLLPVLLRQANTQAETSYAHTAEQDDMEDDNYMITTSPEGETVRVNSEVLREKSNALELLSSVSHALGPGITTVGSNESTTGDWTSYGQTMLELACNLLIYEYSEDVRIAAATMIPPLVRAFRGTHQIGNDYSPKHVENAIPPLLAALAYETETDALGAMFTATSEVVLAAPEAFTAEYAATFVKAVSEQLEGLKQSIEARATLDAESQSVAAEQDEVTLEYISRALQAVIRTTGSNFPIQRLFQALGAAVHGELGIKGDREWGLRMVADLVEFASPNSVAWTAGFLPTAREGLRSEEHALRRICVYTAGVAALVPEGLYANFYRSCIPDLCQLMLRKPTSDSDEDEVAAYDNVLSAIAKILKNDASGSIDSDSIIPTWLSSLPIRTDAEEMEPCYSLLLDLIAREHPLISSSDPQQCSMVLGIFQHALIDPALPKALIEPLNVALNAYLATAPPVIQQEWAAKLST